MRPRPTNGTLTPTTNAGLLRRARRAMAAALIGAGATAACVLALGAATASGDTGTSTESATCAASNPPNEMTLVAGTPQITTLYTGFATTLQVALSNSNGCAVTGAAGIPVTFSAPTSGASGMFSGSGASSVTVGSDSSGNATATALTANDTAGSYTVTASSQYGSISFSLTNTANGVPATMVPESPSSSSTKVSSNYAQPLSVKVLDVNGNPVPGATITYTIADGTTMCGQSTAATATFAQDAGTEATATTDTAGIASSPLLTANSASGTFTATAAITSATGNGSGTTDSSGSDNVSANDASADSQTTPGEPTPVSFTLTNLAGRPQLTAGARPSQTTAVGRRFPIALHATATDAADNPVAGVPITFTAPKAGPSGRFITHARDRQTGRKRTTRRRVVVVKTNRCGIAAAPALDANHRAGSYTLKATAPHTKPAAFALLNRRRRGR